VGFFIFICMIEQELILKYGYCLKDGDRGLDVYENRTSLKLSRIVVAEECRNKGIGKAIMKDLIDYADEHKKIVTLTPSSDFGGDKNRLVQFYKEFGFKLNKGNYKSYEYTDAMIRYPKLNESFKPLIKTLLKERLLTRDEIDVRDVADFVNFSKDFLGIDDDVKVELAFEKTPDIRTTAYYHNGDKRLKVYVKNRAIVDVCRSIAHELVHHKQYIDGRFENAIDPGADGSEFENEANAVAGVIIRKWGKMHPEIYD
jgi:GNAT superfamily N-acetyltransferase